MVKVEFGKVRCRFHGGLSTGPKTEAGRSRIAEAQRRHRESQPALDATAASLGLTLREAIVGTPEQIEQAMREAKDHGAAGVNVLSSALLFALRGHIIRLAAKLGLPAMYQWPETADECEDRFAQRVFVENLLPYGAMVFNAFGPRNAHFEAAMAEAAKVVPWINAQCAREALSPAGLGTIIWAAVDTGEITAEEAPLLVRSLLSAGLDTTIVGIGNALYAFATNP